MLAAPQLRPAPHELRIWETKRAVSEGGGAAAAAAQRALQVTGNPDWCADSRVTNSLYPEAPPGLAITFCHQSSAKKKEEKKYDDNKDARHCQSGSGWSRL